MQGAHVEKESTLVMGRSNSWIVVAMTDMFISAAAVLLVMLAILPVETEAVIPIQANLVAFCPSSASEGRYLLRSVERKDQSGSNGAQNPAEPKYRTVATWEELGPAAAFLNTSNSMLVTIALASTEERALTADCLRKFRRDLVARHNQSVTKGMKSERSAIFAVEPIHLLIDFQENR